MWNSITATSDSIVMQKGDSQIWVYDGSKWKDTKFKSLFRRKPIQLWNTETATKNSINVVTTDYKFYHYDGEDWSLITSKLPTTRSNVQDIVLGHNTNNSLILVTKDRQVYTLDDAKWYKVGDLTGTIGVYTYISPQSFIWNYAISQSSVYIYQNNKLLDTQFNKSLSGDEDISQSYFADPNNPVILTSKNKLWIYKNYHWNKIDNKIYAKGPFAINDQASSNDIVVLTGVNKPDSASPSAPDVLWQQVYVFDGNGWSKTGVPLKGKEYISEVNANASKSSIIVLTSLFRVLIYDGKSWTDSSLILPKNYTIADGAWNAATAMPNSIIVGIMDKALDTKFMLYDGKSWAVIDCPYCASGMDATYQNNINSLIVVSESGQFFIAKDNDKN